MLPHRKTFTATVTRVVDGEMHEASDGIFTRRLARVVLDGVGELSYLDPEDVPCVEVGDTVTVTVEVDAQESPRPTGPQGG
jgi:hypothetical protein